MFVTCRFALTGGHSLCLLDWAPSWNFHTRANCAFCLPTPICIRTASTLVLVVTSMFMRSWQKANCVSCFRSSSCEYLGIIYCIIWIGAYHCVLITEIVYIHFCQTTLNTSNVGCMIWHVVNAIIRRFYVTVSQYWPNLIVIVLRMPIHTCVIHEDVCTFKVE